MPDSNPRAGFLTMRENIVTSDLEGELVHYDPESDQLAVSNNAAAVAVDLCDGTRNGEEIVFEMSTLAPEADDLVEATLRTLDELER